MVAQTFKRGLLVFCVFILCEIYQYYHTRTSIFLVATFLRVKEGKDIV
jgi:hypothetical protein